MLWRHGNRLTITGNIINSCNIRFLYNLSHCIRCLVMMRPVLLRVSRLSPYIQTLCRPTVPNKTQHQPENVSYTNSERTTNRPWSFSDIGSPPPSSVGVG